MRVAALDVGDVRIGVAISDELGMTARGIGVVKRVGGIRDLDGIAKLLAPYEPGCVVIGLPLNMDGSEGPRADKTRRFADRVAAHLGLPIELFDERLTTVAAREAMAATGVRRKRRKGLVDQMAAAIILESYLARPAARPS